MGLESPAVSAQVIKPFVTIFSKLESCKLLKNCFIDRFLIIRD